MKTNEDSFYDTFAFIGLPPNWWERESSEEFCSRSMV